MHINELLPALGLPSKAIVNQPTDKRTLVGGARFPGDVNRIVNDINSIHWLATISQGTSGVPPFLGEDLKYHDISILAVSARRGADSYYLRDTLHSVIPQPVIILFANEVVTDISL